MSDELKLDPQNVRAHPPRNVEMVRQSLEESGPFRGIGVDGDNIIRAGNLTYEQAKALGYTVRVVEAGPTELIAVKRPDLRGREAERAALWDNASGDQAEWDAVALKELQERDAALLKGVLGREELSEILAAAGLGQEPVADPGPQADRAAELQEKWGVSLGDVWQCKGHCIICGDCRETETWGRLLEAAQVEKVNGVFTSPPYAEQRKKQYGGVAVDKYVDWWEAVQASVRANLADDGSFFVNIKPHCEKGERVLYVFDLVLAMKRRWGWRFVEEYAWVKQGFPGDAEKMRRFKNEWESIFAFSRTAMLKFRPKAMRHAASRAIGKVATPEAKTALANIQGRGMGGYLSPDGMAYPGNVLNVRNVLLPDSPSHAAAFPIALPNFFVCAYSDVSDVWLDPFLGSGTTVVAAHQNERRGLGIEVLPKYVAVTLERLAGMGLEPRLVEQHG